MRPYRQSAFVSQTEIDGNKSRPSCCENFFSLTYNVNSPGLSREVAVKGALHKLSCWNRPVNVRKPVRGRPAGRARVQTH